MNMLNCGDFLLYIPVNPHNEFLGYWVVRENGGGGGGEGERGKERACVYVGMYVYTYVYIAKASRNLYSAEYLRLITVCYVSSI